MPPVRWSPRPPLTPRGTIRPDRPVPIPIRRDRASGETAPVPGSRAAKSRVRACVPIPPQPPPLNGGGKAVSQGCSSPGCIPLTCLPRCLFAQAPQPPDHLDRSSCHAAHSGAVDLFFLSPLQTLQPKSPRRVSPSFILRAEVSNSKPPNLIPSQPSP